MKSFSRAERFSTAMKDALRDLLAQRALRVAKPGESFTLSTGKQSRFFFNCKPVTLSADGAPLVAEAFLDALGGFSQRVDAIGGLTVGADPIVVSMMMRGFDRGLRLNGFLVRTHEKAHGLKDLIANAPPAGASVVIVDDVVTTGTSTLQAIAAAKEIGCKVIGAIVLMDRLEENGAANIRREVPQYHAVFTRDDFPEIGEDECHTPNSEQRSALAASS